MFKVKTKDLQFRLYDIGPMAEILGFGFSILVSRP